MDPSEWGHRLNISQHAIDLYLNSDVIDLHVDSFIWTRCLGYRLQRRHGSGLLGARYYSQVDIPRIRAANISGATWVITTNPWRSRTGRSRALARNLQHLTKILESQGHDVMVVGTYSEYLSARRSNLHAAFLGIQGGNAIGDQSSWSLVADSRVLRVTLMHLTNSALGFTSSPLRFGRDGGLSAAGRGLVERLNSLRIIVDLAHTSPRTFWDALESHDKSLPVLVSHTGIDAVYKSWRNLTDEQIKAVADTGGVVGVFYYGTFLGRGLFRGRLERIAAHVAHAVRLVGAQHVALGSDWDGMIVTPKDMPTCLELPKLVQALLDIGLSDTDVQSVLGASFLRMLQSVRP
jgi:membrane dipeptidase